MEQGVETCIAHFDARVVMICRNCDAQALTEIFESIEGNGQTAAHCTRLLSSIHPTEDT